MKSVDNQVKKHGKFKLVRDSSEVGGEVGKFLQEHNLPYDVYYTEGENLPWIYTPSGPTSFIPYEGKGEFNMFRDFYNNPY